MGAELELTVGAVAHGGHCVAREGNAPGGRVVFVRHALPGERVRAVVTEDAGGSFSRADAVEVLVASPDRVAARCIHAGPSRCGGCDWQHVSPSGQRALKATVVAEQFARLAGLELSITVDELPGGLLGWRTRTLYSADQDGRLGLRRHRSHVVERIGHCPLGAPGVGDSTVLTGTWPDCTGVEVVRGDDRAAAVLAHTAGRSPLRPRARRSPDRVAVVDGPPRLHHRVGGRKFEVDAAEFWQVHPAAAATFAAALLNGLRPRPAERVMDLYAGAGLFTALLGMEVGAAGQVLGVESSAQAVSDARGNLADLPWTSVRRAMISAELIPTLRIVPDLIVLDPPRSGAGRALMAALVATSARAIGYVACDPASLARDVRVALDAGWRLASLRAFDAFPMTHHVECVAVLVPADTPAT